MEREEMEDDRWRKWAMKGEEWLRESEGKLRTDEKGGS